MISSSSFHCTLYAGCRSVTRPLLILSCIIFLQINLPAVAAAKGTPVEGFFLDSTKEKKDIKPLQIGDKVPDIEFQMMNYTSPTARLSDFKGKLVILDFWATWCGSCIAHFPENEKLQREFGNKLKILLVDTKNTRDKEKQILDFLQKQKKAGIDNFNLPCVINDSIADHYFPHQLIPHYVWIDESGGVIAITGSNDVNSENIKNALSQKGVSMQVKNDLEMKSDFSKPYLLNNDGRSKGLKSFSIFTNEMNLDVSLHSDNLTGDGLCRGTRILNYPMIYFFQLAYPEMLNIPFNCIEFNVENNELFDMSGKESSGKNRFCYEFMTEIEIPLDTIMQRYLKDDLYKTFHYKGHVENKSVKCYVIVSGEKRELNKRKEGKNGINNNNSTSGEKVSLSDLVTNLNGWWKTPIINEVHNGENSNDVIMPSNADDFPSLKHVLDIAGYSVLVEIRKIPFFIVSEN